MTTIATAFNDCHQHQSQPQLEHCADESPCSGEDNYQLRRPSSRQIENNRHHIEQCFMNEYMQCLKRCHNDKTNNNVETCKSILDKYSEFVKTNHHNNRSFR